MQELVKNDGLYFGNLDPQQEHGFHPAALNVEHSFFELMIITTSMS